MSNSLLNLKYCQLTSVYIHTISTSSWAIYIVQVHWSTEGLHFSAFHYCERSELSSLFNGTDFYIYNCERSELPSLFNARIFYIYIYIYISGRTSCRKKKKNDCCRNPGGDRRPSSTVKYCSATGLLPNRQRGERPGVNGLPFSHRRKETPVFNNLELLVNPSSTAKKCSATEDCCRNPGGDRRPSSTVKYCSATGLLPNRQRGERPGVNGLPFSHRRKETPVFNKLQLLVNRRLRQNRRKRNKPVFNS